MAPPVVARTVVYAGLVTVYFRTHTTTYVPFNGAWNFNPNSYEPMEFHGFIVNDIPTGIWAHIFDLAGDATLTAGDNALAHDNPINAIPSNWQSNRLSGFATGHPLDLSPVIYDYPLAPGHNKAYATFAPNHGLQLPIHTNNTGFPQAGVGANSPAPGGQVQGSSIINLTGTYYTAGGGHLTYDGTGIPLDLGISNLSRFEGPGVAFAGLTYQHGGNPANITDRIQLLATDWHAQAVKYSLTFQNPPGGTDIDDIMTQHAASISSSVNGFLHIEKTTGNFGGVVCNGYGVFIRPDFSSYQIIQLIPCDATAATWTASIGEYYGKLDTTNALWMKNVNIHDTLFVSAAPILRTLPIFPPIPLEPLTDADPFVQMMRGQ